MPGGVHAGGDDWVERADPITDADWQRRRNIKKAKVRTRTCRRARSSTAARARSQSDSELRNCLKLAG